LCLPFKIIISAINIYNAGDNKVSENELKYLPFYENTYVAYKSNYMFIPFGIIFYLIIMISNSYAISKIKYYMDLKFLSPAKLLLIYGFIGTIISLIVGIISTFINCHEYKMGICNIKSDGKYYLENISAFFSDFSKNIFFELLIIIFGSIFHCLYSYFYILVIKKLTPMHIFFVKLISNFLLNTFAWFFSLFTNEKEKNDTESSIFIIYIIRDFIVFIGLLIYLEIIMLKFCELDYDIRKNIIRRSKVEFDSLLEDMYEEKQQNLE
jgi:hypothetical protein